MYLRRGFSLLEALLAIVVVAIAGLGIYSLFDSGVKTQNLSEATDEAVEIANVYTDLASSNLTSSDDDIPALLQKSGRLSSKYFSSNRDAVEMYNAFGKITFSNVSAYGFTVTFPLGCFKGDATSLSSTPGQFYSKVKDVYSCNDAGSKNYATDCAPSVTTCTAGNTSTIKLYFNMNQ